MTFLKVFSSLAKSECDARIDKAAQPGLFGRDAPGLVPGQDRDGIDAVLDGLQPLFKGMLDCPYVVGLQGPEKECCHISAFRLVKAPESNRPDVRILIWLISTKHKTVGHPLRQRRPSWGGRLRLPPWVVGVSTRSGTRGFGELIC